MRRQISAFVLARFWEHPETRGKDYPCTAFRWTLQVDWDKGPWVSVVHQHHLSGEWRDSHTRRVDFGLEAKLFRWEQDHAYYDGPHCHYAAGPFVFQTGDMPPFWENCKKCYGEDK